jgi:acyl carrier protein
MDELDELMQLIIDKFRIGLPIDADTPLLSTGIIDSLHVAELIGVLSRHYDVRFDLADVGVDNFDTVAQMYEMLQPQ